MAIYKMVGDKEKLDKVTQTSFGQEGVLEREDLQRMLCDRPEVLEDGMLIIAEEFGNWQDSNRRIDLLGLDVEGRLVVVELKRGETGGHMDLQAIRYAAMVANMTYEQAIDTYQAYLNKRANPEGGDEPGDAENLLREHLPSNDQDEPVIHTEIPRIILASEDFGKELTTCVLWLNDSWLREAGQEIKCVQLQPHRNDKEIFIEASVIIPLPDASDYQTQLGRREREARSESSARAQTYQGADAFKDSIERASEMFRPGLTLLYEAAIGMEQEKTAELSTTRKGENYTIDLKVPGDDNALVSFTNILQYKGRECGGEIAFRPRLADVAPKSQTRIENLIDSDVLKNRFRRLSGRKYDLDAILATIRDVFQEASEAHTSEAHASEAPIEENSSPLVGDDAPVLDN